MEEATFNKLVSTKLKKAMVALGISMKQAWSGTENHSRFFHRNFFQRI